MIQDPTLIRLIKASLSLWKIPDTRLQPSELLVSFLIRWYPTDYLRHATSEIEQGRLLTAATRFLQLYHDALVQTRPVPGLHEALDDYAQHLRNYVSVSVQAFLVKEASLEFEVNRIQYLLSWISNAASRHPRRKFARHHRLDFDHTEITCSNIFEILHSNRLCLLCSSSSHAAREERRSPASRSKAAQLPKPSDDEPAEPESKRRTTETSPPRKGTARECVDGPGDGDDGDGDDDLSFELLFDLPLDEKRSKAVSYQDHLYNESSLSSKRFKAIRGFAERQSVSMYDPDPEAGASTAGGPAFGVGLQEDLSPLTWQHLWHNIEYSVLEEPHNFRWILPVVLLLFLYFRLRQTSSMIMMFDDILTLVPLVMSAQVKDSHFDLWERAALDYMLEFDAETLPLDFMSAHQSQVSNIICNFFQVFPTLVTLLRLCKYLLDPSSWNRFQLIHKPPQTQTTTVPSSFYPSPPSSSLVPIPSSVMAASSGVSSPGPGRAPTRKGRPLYPPGLSRPSL